MSIFPVLEQQCPVYADFPVLRSAWVIMPRFCGVEEDRTQGFLMPGNLPTPCSPNRLHDSGGRVSMLGGNPLSPRSSVSALLLSEV